MAATMTEKQVVDKMVKTYREMAAQQEKDVLAIMNKLDAETQAAMKQQLKP